MSIQRLSYRKAIIEEFLHLRHVRICYLGTLSKLGGHHVENQYICRLDAIDVDAFDDDYISDEIQSSEENPPL